MNDVAPPLAANLTVPRIERKEALLPSLSQQRLWFASQVGESGLEFIFPYALRLIGSLDRDAMRLAINTVVQRHEVLRTNFVAREGEPFQVIREEFSFDLAMEQIEGADKAEREQALTAALARCVEIPFALDSDLMLRAHLFQLQPEEHVLLLVVHHIATDGWSMDVLFRELSIVYDAACNGCAAELPALPVQFVDYAAWERDVVARGDLEPQMQFWREHLEGAPQELNLPLDKTRPAVQSFEGSWVKFSLPASTVALIDGLANERRATRFQVLLAGYQTVLARWQSRDDIIIGTPAANRLLPETEVLIGFFMNLLPLRGRIDERETFNQLVDRTRSVVIDGFDNQALSFDRLVAELSPERTLSRNPMLQTTLAQESNLPVRLQGLNVEIIEARPNVARYDVAFDYWPDPDVPGALCFDAYYASDLFERESIEALVARFQHFMLMACSAPALPIARIAATAPDESRGLIARGQGGAPIAAADIPARFLEQQRAAPDRVAVVCGDQRMTTTEIAAVAAHVRSRLADVQPDDIVGVCLPRCAEWVGVVLGIMSAGAAYLPLDPEYPQDRLDFMLADSGAKVVITTAAMASRLQAPGRRLHTMDDGNLDGTRMSPAGMPATTLDPSQLAYVIYTSGSTGRPKGVAVSHGSLAGFLEGLELAGAIRPEPARVAWNASASFDASVQQWTRVCRGDTLVLVPEAVRRDPVQLAALCAREHVTDIDMTPSQAESLMGELRGSTGAGQPLRLWVGGESISAALWNRLAGGEAEGIETVNVYGVTEATVDTTWTCLQRDVAPNIGEPLPGNQVFVLDSLMRLVPEGVEGELFIGGNALARGYLGRAGLTAQRFVPNPFAGQPGQSSRLYRTGDRARWTRSGQLEFIGRIDQQVKIRGYRVELGEIEAALRQVRGVEECAVIRRDDDRGVALWAFLRGDVDVQSLRAHAQGVLPAWMCPSGYTFIDAMPRTPNGKLDRDRLAAMETTPQREAAAVPDHRPMTPVEQAIAGIWQEILQLEAVKLDDNFFHLGGHSLLAIKMIAKVKRGMRLSMSMTTIFEKPLLKDFAGVLEQMIRDQMAANSASAGVAL